MQKICQTKQKIKTFESSKSYYNKVKVMNIDRIGIYDQFSSKVVRCKNP